MAEDTTVFTMLADGEEVLATIDAMIAALDELSGAIEGAAASADALGVLDEAFSAVASAAASASASVDALAASESGLDGNTAAAAASQDALAASLDANASASDALAGSNDAASSATDANTASTDANSASKEANAAASDAASASNDGLASHFKSLQMPLALAGAAVVGLGAVAVHMAGDFQASMSQLVTGAGESADNLKMVSDGILSMSTQVGESTSQLFQGMFMVESAGYHGADALNILRDAAEGAKVGNADLGSTANALTTVLSSYGAQGVTAAQATNTLTAIVANGKTHMQDLAASISTVLPAAAKYGVSLTDTSAALATMTSQNGDAASSTTYLRQLLTSLATPSSAAQKSLQSIGLSAQQVSDEMKVSLPDTLQMITDAIGKKFPAGSEAANEAFKNIAGGSKQMQGMLLLTGSSMHTFQGDVKSISDSVTTGGTSIAGWARTQQDFNTKMSQAGAAVQVAMIQVGQALMPVATQLMTQLTPAVQGLTTWIQGHGKETAQIIEILAVAIGTALVVALGAAVLAMSPLTLAAAGIALAVGGVSAAVMLLIQHWGDIIKAFQSGNPVLLTITGAIVGIAGGLLAFFLPAIITATGAAIMGFAGMAVAAWAAITPLLPFIAIGLAVGLVIAGIILVITHWGEITKALQATWQRFTAWFGGMASDFGNAIKATWQRFSGWITGIWNGIWDALKATWQRFVAWIGSIWGDLSSGVQLILTTLRTWIQTKWNDIVTDAKTAWDNFISTILGIGNKINDTVNTYVISPIKNLITGMASDALQWGQNLITQFINGIKNMAGAAGQAASNVVKNVASFLGFHSPAEQGPGADADTWAPNLMKMFAQGLTSHSSQVKAAATQVAQQVQQAMGGLSMQANVGVSGSLPAGALTGASGSYAPMSAAAGGFGGGAMNPQLLQLLQMIAQNTGRTPMLGGSSTSTSIGSITQSFSGVQDLNALYTALTYQSGLASQYGARGASAGIA